MQAHLHKLAFLGIACFSLAAYGSASLAQSDETVERTRQNYLRQHPGEKTYTPQQVMELYEPLDPLPGPRVMTWEKWRQVQRPVFGATLAFGGRSLGKKVNDFTRMYYESPEFATLVENNIIGVSVSDFRTFVERNRQPDFRFVYVWTAGYLEFSLNETFDKRTGTAFVAFPVNPELKELLEHRCKEWRCGTL